ncbi:F-box protein SKIP23-like [Neltuma alba]|uniref:F-box protein SKIP23-like n=1 Tax=Neltuma alba TaxID=207710 RepID=UPI0010A47C7A|nr:F-box protein SKIP23-like [Prosopis alba]
MDSHSSTPSWSGLSRDLLLDIVNRLDSRIDRLSVRAVCPSWRSKVPPPPRRSSPPLNLPFPVGPNPDLNPRLRGYFDFAESTVYCFQPLRKISGGWRTPKCWLIKIEEAEELGTPVVRFKDPLYRFDYYCRDLSPHLPERLNLLDYRVSEIAKFYELRYASTGKQSLPQLYSEIQSPDLKSLIVKRVAVCSESAHFAVMTIHTGGHLSIWRKGDKKWTRINDGRDVASYNDVVYHDGKFYAVDNSGFTISVDFSLKITSVAPVLPPCGYNKDDDREKRLVNSLGDLFLLDKDRYPLDVFLARCDPDDSMGAFPTYFHVYKLNEEKRQWVRVKSLGNRAVIVCDMCAFSISAQDFRGFKKNCIYYSEDCFCGRDKEPGHDAALFDMEDCSACMLPGVTGYSGVFWPPPSWVVSARKGDAETVSSNDLMYENLRGENRGNDKLTSSVLERVHFRARPTMEKGSQWAGMNECRIDTLATVDRIGGVTIHYSPKIMTKEGKKKREIAPEICERNFAAAISSQNSNG